MGLNDAIAATLENLPDSPGVYIMRNAVGRIIYVGKAISLKNRVRQYFHPSTQREQPKTRRLVQDIVSIDYLVVKTEAEALMLECNLIKQHHPRYNILLKDSKHFPYLRLDLREDFPRLEIVRRVTKNDRARYFGPYLGANTLRRTLEIVRKVFPIRSCTADIHRMIERHERPCLNFQLGLCVAPCRGTVSREEYHTVVNEVMRFLSGRHAEIAADLREQMKEAAANLEFERAAALRDKLRAVESVVGLNSEQNAISTVQEDLDVVGVHIEANEAAVQLMMVRGGKVVGSEGFLLEGSEDETRAEVLRSFLEQFYLNAVLLPRAIVLGELPPNHEALADYLRERAGRKVEVMVPQRGERVRLLELAEANAKERMEREHANRLREWERTGGAVKALGDILGLPLPPNRIECYDISNIQGTDSVASMVVFEGGKSARNQYRRFRIKTVEGANDFESMREVLTRRFRHGLEEQEELKASGGDVNGSKFAKFPDLVLIDGGRIQLEFGRDAMVSLGVGHIPAIGLAKRNEEIILENQEEPLVLPRNSAALHLLERVRDEAHRFAITYHRSLRSARTLRSRLEAVPGIGPKRVRELLKAYPVPAMLEELSVEELLQVPGMNRPAAEAVWNFLHLPKDDPGQGGAVSDIAADPEEGPDEDEQDDEMEPDDGAETDEETESAEGIEGP